MGAWQGKGPTGWGSNQLGGTASWGTHCISGYPLRGRKSGVFIGFISEVLVMMGLASVTLELRGDASGVSDCLVSQPTWEPASLQTQGSGAGAGS